MNYPVLTDTILFIHKKQKRIRESISTHVVLIVTYLLRSSNCKTTP